MNWNNIYFKFDNKDGISDELLEKIDQLPYHNKIILVQLLISIVLFFVL